MPSGYRMATEDENALARKQLRNGNAMARAAVKKRGYKIHPRVAAMRKKPPHELVAFLAMYAVDYAKFFKLNGLHPIHYDLMKKYGARMDDVKRATDAD